MNDFVLFKFCISLTKAVNPVSVGKTRCRHLELGEGEYGISNWSDKILNLQASKKTF
jgi:hypothetical protein